MVKSKLPSKSKTKLPSSTKNRKQSYLFLWVDTHKKGSMPSKETIYQMAAYIFASGSVSLRESALYAVKLAGFVDEEIKCEGMPKCFKSNPSLETRAHNGCSQCKHNDACFEDKK